jgi:hypothetical protein
VAALAVTLAAPAVAAEAQEPTSILVTGQVVQVITEDQKHAEPTGTTQLLRTTDGELVALAEGTELPVDRRVTAELSAGPGETMTVDSYRVRSTATATAPADGSAATPTVHQVYVALMTPLGRQLSDNTNTGASVTRLVDAASAYWSSQTGGAVSFEVTRTVGNYKSAYPCSPDPATTFGMWEEAQGKFGVDEEGAPVSSGVDKHLLLVAPDGSSWRDGCPYGLGTLGSGIHDDGNLVFVSGAHSSLYAHELGHNLGLNHSNGLDCRRAQDSALSVVDEYGWPAVRVHSGCRATEYDDLLDVMGFSGPTYGEGNLNVAHVDDLGVDGNALHRVPVGDREVVRIAPLSRTTAGVRGIQVTDHTGVDYFVQYRTPSGRDRAALANDWSPRLGVEVLREDPAAQAPTGSYLLDPTPTTSDRKDYARTLPVGGVFRSDSGLLTVKVTSADSTGATLAVTNSDVAQVPATFAVTAPTRVRKQAVFTVSAKVFDQAGIGSPYWPAQLQRRPRGADGWSSVALATNSSGAVSHRTSIKTATRFRWVTRGSRAGEPAPARVSDVVLVRAK